MAVTEHLAGPEVEGPGSCSEQQSSGVGVSGSGGGPGGWGPGGWGPGGFGGPGGHGGRGERDPQDSRGLGDAARLGRRGSSRGADPAPLGDVRAAILLLLDEWPMRGLQLIQAISQRSGAVWTPSPGAMDPVLSALEDEGKVSIAKVGGRSTASLTPRGAAFVERSRVALGEPWDDVEGAAASEARASRTPNGRDEGSGRFRRGPASP